MAERPRFYERRWARAAAAAVGALALSACGPNSQPPAGTNYVPRDYDSFGQLECYKPSPAKLRGVFDFSDRAVKTIVVFALMGEGAVAGSMRIKYFGPESSVAATNQAEGEVDIDQGVLTYEEPLVIDDVLDRVKVTATLKTGTKEMTVEAECA
jgi:hypothetical protein